MVYVLEMSENASNGEKDDGLNDSINGELPNGADEAGLGASSGSDNDILHKKRKTQTPSPRPVPHGFMVQGG